MTTYDFDRFTDPLEILTLAIGAGSVLGRRVSNRAYDRPSSSRGVSRTAGNPHP